jgi:small conductance mechanosensitive channel
VEVDMPDWAMSIDKFVTVYLIPVGWKVLGAIVMWVVGGWAINLIGRLSARGMTAQNVDPTLIKYADSTIKVVLRMVLVIAILSVFGIETTSFAALLAAAGIAIGAAWAGLLANFAAGAFLIILRPFRVGEMITAGGVTGEVREIGLFATTLDTADNLRVIVGNNKLFADNIVNYSHNPYRRVDLKAQIANGVDPRDAITRLSYRVRQVPNVLGEPAPSVQILEFNASGVVIAVRPFCHNKDYWQVYFDTRGIPLAPLASSHWHVVAVGPHRRKSPGR